MPRLVTVERPAAPPDLAPLESYLWGAASVLRCAVDAADFKSYIFPLLFFNSTCVRKVRVRGCLKEQPRQTV